MSWDRDPLWAKARLFFEHALSHDRDDLRFGLWCTFGLEILGRAALSSISPALLAEPDRDHRHLLHILGRGNPKVGPQSIGASQVFKLCETLIANFTAEHTTSAVALLNRRNAELHSGEAAFADYTTQHWISGLYACCKVLAESMNETLETLLGSSEAAEAATVLATTEKAVSQRVRDRIVHYKAVFQDRSDVDRQALRAAAEAEGEKLAHARHHRVKCPACDAIATLQGDALGASKVEDQDGEIVVKQAVAPRRFACAACGLKLDGYAELNAAGLASQYTRTTRYSPEEYYELINPDDHAELARIAHEELGMHYPEGDEYDNE
jgi:Arc/MetJ-type ribon-helix-helix transcriptional regulator